MMKSTSYEPVHYKLTPVNLWAERNKYIFSLRYDDSLSRKDQWSFIYAH